MKDVLPIFWTPEALSSLEGIVDFLEHHWSEKIVNRVLNAIDNSILSLQEHPQQASFFPKTPIRRVLVHPHLSIFYEVESTRIKILLCWDNRQNPELLIQKLIKSP